MEIEDAFESVKRLLEAGADLESRDNQGRTPLSLAAVRGGRCHLMANFLLDMGANLESGNCHGRPPVSWTAPPCYEAWEFLGF